MSRMGGQAIWEMPPLEAIITFILGLPMLIMLVGLLYLLFYYCIIKPTKDLKRVAESKKEAQQEQVKWQNEIEPKLRMEKFYPIDWQRRRAIVYIKSGGQCSSCGKWLPGKLKCAPEEIWNYHMSYSLFSGAEVHHKNSIADGGDHSLENLELLCLDCHAKKHPGNVMLSDRSHSRKVERLGFRASARVYCAGKHYICGVCGNDIRRREYYFGYKGRGNKICVECYRKHDAGKERRDQNWHKKSHAEVSAEHPRKKRGHEE